MEVHIVQKGDTLWKISRQYGISFEELKRVNAHLANPDYIVPGMKIFLPNERKNQQVPPQKKQEPVKKIEKVEKRPIIEKQPVERPTLPEEKKEQPKKPEREHVPIPLPKPPTITTKPIDKEKSERPKQEKPPKPQVEKPLPKPEQPKVPPQQEQIPQQVPPMIPMQPYPVFGIPCGWMPIYDADCYGHHHYGRRQDTGRQHGPTRPMTQLRVEESSHHQPSTKPVRPAEPERKPLPSLKDVEDANFGTTQPQLTERPLMVPNFTPNIESSSIPLPKVEKKEPFIPPTYDGQTDNRVEQQRPSYPTAPTPQQHEYPVQPGAGPSYGGPQFIPVLPPTMPMQPQSHPFCQQCHQPIGQHTQRPMYFPGFYPWQGSYS